MAVHLEIVVAAFVSAIECCKLSFTGVPTNQKLLHSLGAETPDWMLTPSHPSLNLSPLLLPEAWGTAYLCKVEHTQVFNLCGNPHKNQHSSIMPLSVLVLPRHVPFYKSWEEARVAASASVMETIGQLCMGNLELFHCVGAINCPAPGYVTSASSVAM